MYTIRTKQLVQVALLVATEVVLSRFLSINTPIVRIGFGFIPIAVTGMLFGPLWAGCAAAMGDFIGAMLFPTGPFFPGFTLTAFLTGFTYGSLLRGGDNRWQRILPAVAIVLLPLNLGLDTLWLSITYPTGHLGLLPTRILKCMVMAPLQVVTLRWIAPRLPFLYEKKR